MSDSINLSELAAAVASLTQALDLLSLRVAELEARVESTEGWEVLEPSVQSTGAIPDHTIVAEESPPPVPLVFFDLASGLGGTVVEKRARVSCAFAAGYHAKVALKTHTAYTPIVPKGPALAHWVVIRSGGLKTPFRVSRKSDLNRFLEFGGQPFGPAEVGPIVQGFASIAEVRAFCGGAALELPALLWCNGQDADQVR